MGGTQTLTGPEEGTQAVSTASGSCPCCEEPWGGLPHAETRTFPDLPLRRCRHCGGRFVAEAGRPRLLVSCAGCSLPFLTDDYHEPTRQKCPNCRSGRVPVDLPDAGLISAADAEVRAALDEDCSFLHAPALAEYVDRVARVVAAQVEGAPADPNVALIDDPGVRMLALPSGLIALSVGALASLEDEAELAFVLAHELAHAAAGDAAVRLLRQGLLEMAASEQSVPDVWRFAVEDMLALGYGRTRELDADDRALRAMLAVGYEPEAAVRWLSRLDARIRDADPGMRSYVLSHPTPSQRRSRILEALALRVEPPGNRLNREVFRRAAGREVLASALVRVDRLRDACRGESPADAAEPSRALPTFAWVAIGFALTALIVALILLA